MENIMATGGSINVMNDKGEPIESALFSKGFFYCRLAIYGHRHTCADPALALLLSSPSSTRKTPSGLVFYPAINN
jgi:hypothetical protein